MSNSTIIELILALLILLAFVVFAMVNSKFNEQEKKLREEQMYRERRNSDEQYRTNKMKKANEAVRTYKMSRNKDEVSKI